VTADEQRLVTSGFSFWIITCHLSLFTDFIDQGSTESRPHRNIFAVGDHSDVR